jgi:hypothetical protein
MLVNLILCLGSGLENGWMDDVIYNMNECTIWIYE